MSSAGEHLGAATSRAAHRAALDPDGEAGPGALRFGARDDQRNVEADELRPAVIVHAHGAAAYPERVEAAGIDREAPCSGTES